MNKKRLSVFSLLIALTLTLGACDDLEDLFPTGSDSDESTELTEDEDPSSGVNPNEDEDENEEENNDDDNDDEEKGDEPVITYSLSITNKADLLSLAYDEDNPTTTDYTLAVSLLTYTDGELTATSQLSSSDVTVTSSNEEVATVNGITLTLGSVTGSSEIVAAWNTDSSVTDSFTLSYTYTAHVEKIDYEYNLSITNKTELLGTDSIWLIDSGVHTFELGLTKTTIIDGVEGDSEQVTNFTASLSQTDLSGNEASIVSIDGLSVTPAALGSVRITATFTDGDYSASDYIEVMINESYYEDDYSLKINNVTDFTGTDDAIWRVGTGIDLDVTLSYKWYAYSTGLAASEEQTLVGTYSNLSVLVYDSSSQCVTGDELGNDIYYYTLDGTTLTLVPQASAAGNTYTILVYWTGHTEAYETFTVTIGEKLTNSYTLTVTTNEIPSPWYYEDKDSYNVSFTITEYDVETQSTSSVNLSEISTELICYSTNDSVATVSFDTDYSVKITALSAGTASIYFGWSTHLETITHIDLNIAEHVYTLLINTPTEGLGTEQTPWRIEEGTRSISLSATMDGAEATPTYVVVESSNTEVVTVSGSSDSYTLTPVAKGNTTIVASWYKESGEDTPLATAVVPVYISDEIVAVSVSLTQTSISFNAPNETATITASVYGANNAEATNQNVMWSVTGSGVSISVNQNTYMLGSTEVTVSATAYSSSATITATSEDGGLTASCVVAVADQPAVAAKVVSETATSTIVSSPDDRGVYVLGNEGGTQFIDSSLGLTSDYNSAAAVRTILADDSTSYYLAIGEKYLSSSGTLVDAIDSAVTFTISSSGVSSLYLGESGLTTTGGSTIYILDETYTETVSSTTGGTYYLATNVDGTIKYASGFTGSSNYRMYTSSNINDAIEFTITNVGGDEYTMTYSNSGTTTYVYLDESTSSSGSVSGYIKTSTSKKTIYYDATNNVWGSTEDPETDRFIGYNSAAGDGQFGNYAHGNISSYPNATLYEADKVDAIGISVVPDSYSLEQQEHTNLTLTTYPSVAGDLTFDDLNLTQSGTGSVTTSDGVLYTGAAGDVHVTFTYKNNSSINDSFDFEVIEDTSDVDKHEYSYTFASGNGISTSGGTVTLGDLSWTSSSAVYIGGEYSNTSRGLQIGSSNSTQTEPWTLSTTFSEEITLTSITLTLTVASSGSATYSIDLSDNSIASKVAFTTTKSDYTHDELSVTGTVLTITLQASSKAMYIASISFTYTTPKAS